MARSRRTTKTAPPKAETSFQRVYRDTLWTLRWITTWVIIAFAIGAPAAGVQQLIRMGVSALTTLAAVSGPTAVSFETGLLAGIALLMNAVVLILLPVAWRHISHPNTLRVLAYAAIMIWAVATGLLIPDPLIGWMVTLDIAGAGSAGWWMWQRQWRGAGVAPSPLAGALRPDLHTGQIWYAVVAGSHETKVRPVIILAPADNGQWTVAYFTSQPPRDHRARHYLEIPEGSLRGLPKANWASLRDPRELTRKQFRTYSGLAPTWVYVQLCQRFNLFVDPHAFTVNETSAGQHGGPIEHLFHRMFRLQTTDADVRSAASANFRAFMRMTIIPPRPGRTDPPARRKKRPAVRKLAPPA